jgi:hypothetical protein
VKCAVHKTERGGRGKLYYMHIGFAFHQRSVISFIYLLPPRQGQREESRENSKNSVLPKIEEYWTKKVFSLLLVFKRSILKSYIFFQT